MIVDSSAMVAILLDEPERDAFRAAIASASACRISAASYVETGVVVDSADDALLSRRFDELLGRLDIQVVDVTSAQARIARQAYREFGRGSGHPARLNFGDCFSYALAVESGEPLLWKGDAFGHTDVRSARR